MKTKLDISRNHSELCRRDVLLTEFNLVAEESVNPKVLLQRMVDVLRKGGLKNRDEPSSPMHTVDVRGFDFKNAKGKYPIHALSLQRTAV